MMSNIKYLIAFVGNIARHFV